MDQIIFHDAGGKEGIFIFKMFLLYGILLF